MSFSYDINNTISPIMYIFLHDGQLLFNHIIIAVILMNVFQMDSSSRQLRETLVSYHSLNESEWNIAKKSVSSLLCWPLNISRVVHFKPRWKYFSSYSPLLSEGCDRVEETFGRVQRISVSLKSLNSSSNRVN